MCGAKALVLVTLCLCFRAIRGDPLYVMFHARSMVSTSEDGGLKWNHVDNQNQCYQIVDVKCLTPTKCYAITSTTHLGCTANQAVNGVITTMDTFRTFRRFKLGGAGVELNSIDCWDAAVCIAVGSNAGTGLVLRTETAWEVIQPTNPTTDALTTVATMPYGIAVAIGANGVLIRTADYGRTWIAQNMLATTLRRDFQDMSCFMTVCIIVGRGEVILYSRNSGATWQKGAVPYSALCNADMCPQMHGDFERVSCASSRFCAMVSHGTRQIPGGLCWTFDEGVHWECHKERMYADVDNKFLGFWDIHCAAEGHCVSTLEDPPRRLAVIVWKSMKDVEITLVSENQVFQIPHGVQYLIGGTKPIADTYSISGCPTRQPSPVTLHLAIALFSTCTFVL